MMVETIQIHSFAFGSLSYSCSLNHFCSIFFCLKCCFSFFMIFKSVSFNTSVVHHKFNKHQILVHCLVAFHINTYNILFSYICILYVLYFMFIARIFIFLSFWWLRFLFVIKIFRQKREPAHFKHSSEWIQQKKAKKINNLCVWWWWNKMNGTERNKMKTKWKESKWNETKRKRSKNLKREQFQDDRNIMHNTHTWLVLRK